MPFVRFQFINGSDVPADSWLHLFDGAANDIWVNTIDPAGPVPPGGSRTRVTNHPNVRKVSRIFNGNFSQIEALGVSNLTLQNDVDAPPGEEFVEAVVTFDGPSARFPARHGTVRLITNNNNVLTAEFVQP